MSRPPSHSLFSPDIPRWFTFGREQTRDPFRLALDASPTGMLIMDEAGRILFANKQIEALFGYDRGDLLGQSLTVLVPSGQPELLAPEPAGWRVGSADLHGVRKDGSEIPIELDVSSLQTAQGHFGLGAVTDISGRKRIEAQLRDQLRERDVLLQEIHHRVKNNLQVISSLISLQLGRMEPGRAYDALQECSLRVLAIAHIHEQLYVSKDFARVPFSEYAHTLSGIVFRTTGVSSDRVRLSHDLKPVSVSVDAAIPCGLILNEVITNALKHAFPNDRRGGVRVELGKLAPDKLLLVVSDDGVGLPPGFDIGKGESLGMQLIQTLAAQIGGEFKFESGERGTRFELVFPATD